jgi:hypothetical protein
MSLCKGKKLVIMYFPMYFPMSFPDEILQIYEEKNDKMSSSNYFFEAIFKTTLPP